PPVPPFTTATTGMVTLPLADPDALIVIVAVFTPLASEAGFRCTVNVAGVSVALPPMVTHEAEGVIVIGKLVPSLEFTVTVASLHPPPDWKLHVTVPARLFTVA